MSFKDVSWATNRNFYHPSLTQKTHWCGSLLEAQYLVSLPSAGEQGLDCNTETAALAWFSSTLVRSWVQESFLCVPPPPCLLQRKLPGAPPLAHAKGATAPAPSPTLTRQWEQNNHHMAQNKSPSVTGDGVKDSLNTRALIRLRKGREGASSCRCMITCLFTLLWVSLPARWSQGCREDHAWNCTRDDGVLQNKGGCSHLNRL